MPDSPRWTIEVTPQARRDLRNLAPADRGRLLVGIQRLGDFPNAGDLRKLSGGGSEWRLRVGDWRVRFEPIVSTVRNDATGRDEQRRTIAVLRVLPRGRAYRD